MKSSTLAERIANVAYDFAGRDKEEVRACNLCGHGTFALLTDRDRYGFEARTHLCLRCGLGVMSPHLTATEFSDFYARWYRPLCEAVSRPKDQEAMEALKRDQFLYARWLSENLLSRFITSAHHTVLDIGGSTGAVATFVGKRNDLTPVVLDPSQDELVEARAAGCKVIHALWEEYEPGSERFDVVLLCRTADHLLDLSGSLSKVRRIIAPDGLFYVDIVDFLGVARNSRCISRATKIDHVYYLTHPPMLTCLRRCGFAPLAVDFSRSERVAYVCRPCEPEEAPVDQAYAVRLLETLQAIPREPLPKPRPERSLLARGVRRLLSYV